MEIRPRHVVRYEATLNWVYRVERLLEGAVAAFWLGRLDPDQLADVDRAYHDSRGIYHGDEHNRKGLMPWEQSVVDRDFRACRSLLVASVGGGREAIALRRQGYDVDAFECHPDLVDVANALLAAEGFPPSVSLAPRDGVPALDRTYDGVIVGWGAYSLIAPSARRRAFLAGLREHLQPGGPLLVSFFVRAGSGRYYDYVARVANGIRSLMRRPPVESGDVLAPNFVHHFNENELRAEFRASGLRLVDFATSEYGYAVGRSPDDEPQAGGTRGVQPGSVEP